MMQDMLDRRTFVTREAELCSIHPGWRRRTASGGCTPRGRPIRSRTSRGSIRRAER